MVTMATRLALICLCPVTISIISGCNEDIGYQEASKGYPTKHEIQARYHVRYLASGDFRARGIMPVPLHLEKLIEIGPPACQELLSLLRNDEATPFFYVGRLAFFRHMSSDCTIRTATLGDMADYALRQIYRHDVGYRSYLPDNAREKAISKWESVTRNHGK